PSSSSITTSPRMIWARFDWLIRPPRRRAGWWRRRSTRWARRHRPSPPIRCSSPWRWTPAGSITPTRGPIHSRLRPGWSMRARPHCPARSPPLVTRPSPRCRRRSPGRLQNPLQFLNRRRPRVDARDALDGEGLLGERLQLLSLDADIAEALGNADVALQLFDG